jgi:hypothetical protein
MSVVDRINLLDKENILGFTDSATDKTVVNTTPSISKIINATGGDLEKGVDKILKAPSSESVEKVLGAITGEESKTPTILGGAIGAIDQNNVIDRYFNSFSAGKAAFKQLGTNCIKDLLGNFDCKQGGKLNSNGKSKYTNANGCSISAMSDLLSMFNDQYRSKVTDPCSTSNLLKSVVGKAANMGFSDVYSSVAGAFDPMDAVNAGAGLIRENSQDFDLMDDIGGSEYSDYLTCAVPGVPTILAKNLNKPREVTATDEYDFDTGVIRTVSNFDSDWDTNNGMASVSKVSGANSTFKNSLSNVSKSKGFDVGSLLASPSTNSHWTSGSESLFSFL